MKQHTYKVQIIHKHNYEYTEITKLDGNAFIYIYMFYIKVLCFKYFKNLYVFFVSKEHTFTL